MTLVTSVRGPVDSSDLGHVAPHEHILSNSSRQAWDLHQAATERLAQLGIAEFERDLLTAPIGMNNLHWIRRHALNAENLTLDDEDAAAESLIDFKFLGGSTVVECTPIGLHRDPRGLLRIADRVDLHIIMGCGWYLHEFHPPYLAEASVDELADRMLADLSVGAAGTDIRSGFIGEIGTGWPVHPAEQRVLQAAAKAQQTSGAAIQVHPGRHGSAPLECVRLLADAGADLHRVAVSHLDRTLTTLPELTKIAESGCYLEFDMFGQESTYYPYGWFDVPNDAGRVDLLAALVDAGHRDRLLISQDLGYRTLLPRWGGPGYAHILREVIPLMRRHGFSPADIQALTRVNPARWLCGEEPA